MGPTASGKTDLALKLVKCFDCDIISVDSAMIFRGMDIGTAKPDPETLATTPHRLIDFLDPSEAYSAARFLNDARREIDDITQHGRTPLLVGGTMMYYRILQLGIAELPEADPRVREELDRRADELGWPAVHAELEAVDPQAAARIDANDSQRIQRALEVHILSGEAISKLQERGGVGTPDVDFVKLGLWPEDRAGLHTRINQRFDEMMAAGFLDEVRALHQRKDLNRDMPSMRCVGYRQLWEHLDGDCDLAHAVRKAKTATRQLAKRQLTWLRAERDTLLVDSFAADCEQEVTAAINHKLGA